MVVSQIWFRLGGKTVCALLTPKFIDIGVATALCHCANWNLDANGPYINIITEYILT